MQIIPINDLNLKQEWLDIQSAVEEGLDYIANSVQEDFVRPTLQWEHKPDFVIEKTTFTRSIYTLDPNYIRINNGTNRSGYTEGKPNLWLPDRYAPKTHASDLYGYGGVREYTRGKNVFKRVKQSSIKARKWDEWIQKLWTEHQNIADFIQRKINQK